MSPFWPNRRAALSGLAASLALGEASAAEESFQVIEAGSASVAPGLAFNGLSPGPALRIKKGEEARLRVVNRLAAPLALHWHGMRIAHAWDSGAPAIAPGASFDFRFTPPDSGMFLYRARDGRQMARGLAGALIVEEAAEAGPEHVAILQERPRERAGEKAILTLNGAPPASELVRLTGSRLRLRLANACANRIAILSFEGFRAFITAIDGQPCDPFEPVRNTIPAGPGARFDVLLDFPREGRVILRGDKEPDVDLLRLTGGGEAASSTAPLGQALNPLLPPVIRLQNSVKTDMNLSGGGGKYSLLGKPGGQKPLFSAPRNTPVTLGFSNRTALPATFHVHGHCMRLLHDLDDGWEPYWRDSVIVNAGKTHHVAFLADNPGKWPVEAISAEPDAPASGLWFEIL